MIIIVFLSLIHFALQLGNASIMEVNTEKFLQIFIFMDLKNSLNWLRNKIAVTKENFKEIIKHCFE